MNQQQKRQESYEKIDQEDIEGIHRSYYAKSIYKTLGITRETVRYYEKIGLLDVEKEEENGYRVFSIRDFEKLMWFDLYKKHGYQSSKLKEIMSYNEPKELLEAYENNEIAIQKQINLLQRQLEYIQQDKMFLKDLEKKINQFSIEDYPLYEIVDSLSSVSAFYESNGQEFLQKDKSWMVDGINSHILRRVTFDENGYKSSQLCYIKKASQREEGKNYLISGKCIYTVAESLIENYDTMGRMFELCYSWGKKEEYVFKGEVYIVPRIFLMGNQPKTYYDSFIPIK